MLFLCLFFHPLGEGFFCENNLSFDIILIAKKTSKGKITFIMIQQDRLQFHKNIKFNFNGGNLTSDAGLLFIHESCHQVKFPQLLNEFFYREHDVASRSHTNSDLCLQPIFQTIAGYHCANDADELRVEPLFTALLTKKSLASQPTLSRFYHRFTKETGNSLVTYKRIIMGYVKMIFYCLF